MFSHDQELKTENKVKIGNRLRLKLITCGLDQPEIYLALSQLLIQDFDNIKKIILKLSDKILSHENLMALLQHAKYGWEMLSAIRELERNKLLTLGTFKAIMSCPSRSGSIAPVLVHLSQANIFTVENIQKISQQKAINLLAMAFIIEKITEAGIFKAIDVGQAQKNFISVLQYPQFIEEIKDEVLEANPLNQIAFDKIINSKREKMEVSVLLGTNSRLGERSLFHKPFQTRPGNLINSKITMDPLADHNVFKEIFKFI